MASAHDAPAAGLDPRAIRVRTGVLLVILADAMFMASILAGDLYLGALNVLGQFKPPAEGAPSLVVGLVLTLIAVVSALSYGWAARALSSGGEAGFMTGVRVALALIVVAFLAQVWVVATLGFRSPLHGYGSMTILLSAYHGFHLLVTAIVGVLIVGRSAAGRLVGQPYLAQVVGYWWYYVAIAAMAIWVVGLITQGMA